MNIEMMQKLIEYGARQERSRNDFIADLINQYIPVIGRENEPIATPVTRPARTGAPRGRRPNPNGLAMQIRALLGEDGGTVEDIAMATGATDKKVVGALNSMKARGIVTKSGKCWTLAGGNGAAASI